MWREPAALAAFERRSRVSATWRRLAEERWRVDLGLVSARGRWSGRSPFGSPWAARPAGGAPIGVQGTFSVWASEAALCDYAYRGTPQRAVIRQTQRTGWYVEDLFARFAVLQATGTFRGTDPLR